MRNFIYLALLVTALIVVCLYLLRVNTVPADVKKALETEQETPLNNMGQIPARVKQKMEAANRMADSSMGNALKSVDGDSK